MDGSEAASGPLEEAARKMNPLESLSKEDLIKKCKSLLLIAKKAKEAKDEANEEVKAMKEKMLALQTNGDRQIPEEKADGVAKEKELEKQINAMQELVGSLTDQKLQFAMEMDTFKKKTAKLEDELIRLKESENILKNKVSDLEIERDGFERQARRLEKEAESLTVALDETDRQGNEKLSAVKAENEKLRKELEILKSKSQSELPPEGSAGNDEGPTKLSEIEDKCNTLQNEIDLFTSLIKVDQSSPVRDNNFKSLKFAWDSFVELKNHNISCSQEIDQLKKMAEERSVLEEKIEELDKLAEAGKLAQDQIRKLADDKEVLQSQIQSLKAALAVFNDYKDKLMAVEVEKQALEVRVTELQNEKELVKELKKLLAQTASEKEELESRTVDSNELKMKLDSMESEKSKLLEKVEELERSCADKTGCEEKLEKILSENRLLHRNFLEIEEKLSSSLKEVNELKGQREDFETKISGLEMELEKLKGRLTQVLEENERLTNEMRECKNAAVENNGLKDKYLEVDSERMALEEKVRNLQLSLENAKDEKEELLKLHLEEKASFQQFQEEAKDKLNASEAGKVSLMEEVEGLKKSCDELLSKLSSKNEEMENVIEKVQSLETTTKEYENQKARLEAERETILSENTALKESSDTQIKVLLEEKDKLEKQLHQLKGDLREKAACELRLVEVESDRRVVIAELENLRLLLSEAEGVKDQLRGQNDALKEKSVALEERLRVAEEGVEGVREALENKVNSLQSTVREKEALESELSELKEALVAAERKIQDIEDANNLLEGESCSLRESLKEQNKVVERLQEVEEGKDGMEREIEVLRASLKEESALKAHLEVEKQTLEKEVVALRTTVKDEDKVIERLREVEEEKDGMEREIEALRISLKDESKLREMLRIEREEKEAFERELEALKVTLAGEAKVRESLRSAVEGSSLLEKEVEGLKLALKEQRKVSEDLKEALMQSETGGKERVEEIRVGMLNLEKNCSELSKEKKLIMETNEKISKESTSLKKKLATLESENAALNKTLLDIENLSVKWEELMEHSFSINVLDQILSSLSPGEASTVESSDVKTLQSPNIASLCTELDANDDTAIGKVTQALQNGLTKLNQINIKSEKLANGMKKAEEDKSKMKKDMDKKVQKLKAQNEELKKKRESEQSSLMREICAIREAIGVCENSESGVNNASWDLQDASVKVKNIVHHLNEEKDRLEKAVSSLEAENRNGKDIIEELEKKVKELEEGKYNLEQQLISEMKSVNTALKKRGETIATLEADVAKLTSQLLEEQEARKQVELPRNPSVDLKESVANSNCALPQAKVENKRSEDLEDECKSLRLKVSDLEKQIQGMNSRGLGVCDNVASEVLSTSTISKTEEAARLKDVEDVFEDRYTKLRIVAVKLKRRCTELEGEKKRADELQGRVNNLNKDMSNLSTQAKNAQSLQLECDRVQDKVDELLKENNLLKKSLKESVDECAVYKMQVQDYKAEKNHLATSLEIAKKDKFALEAGLQEANAKKKSSEKEYQRLEQELNATKTRLSQEEARCADVLKQLEEGKQTWKRGNVLSLEIDALEQSAADLRRQLEESREEASKLKGSLSQAEEELEKSRIKEEEAKVNKELLKECQEKLKECEKLKNEACENVEHLRRNLESQSLQLGKMMADTKRQTDSFRAQQEAVLAQASVLETQVTRLRSELAEKNAELEQVRSDFAVYKVRAQGVLLRKQQEREADGGGNSRRDKEEEEAKEQEWERERQQLERVADGLRRTLEDITNQLDETLRERESLDERCEALDMECQRLREVQKKLEEQHREEMFQGRIKLDTLVRSYKQQLEDLQDRYRTETTSLREQVEKLKSEKESIAAQVSSSDDRKKSRASEDHGRGSGAHGLPWGTSADGPLEARLATEMALHPREEGEGSESVDSPPSPHSSFNSRSHGKMGVGGRRKKKGLLPLDQLLSSSSLPDEEETDMTDHDALQGDEDDGSIGDWVSGRTSSNMVATLERRSKHLSMLLSEAESEGARLAQQNALLKEEVRRLERCAERTEHTQNAEYLKNVLFKFITLHGGDERSRLVPVLTTILKLSREETAQLNAVASGGSPSAGQGTNAGRGWGSYLWPSAP